MKCLLCGSELDWMPIQCIADSAGIRRYYFVFSCGTRYSVNGALPILQGSSCLSETTARRKHPTKEKTIHNTQRLARSA